MVDSHGLCRSCFSTLDCVRHGDSELWRNCVDLGWGGVTEARGREEKTGRARREAREKRRDRGKEGEKRRSSNITWRTLYEAPCCYDSKFHTFRLPQCFGASVSVCFSRTVNKTSDSCYLCYRFFVFSYRRCASKSWVLISRLELRWRCECRCQY